MEIIKMETSYYAIVSNLTIKEAKCSAHFLLKSSGKSCVVYKKGVSAALAGAGGEARLVEAAAGWSEDSEVIGKMREELGAPDTLGVIETGVRNDPLLVFKLPGRNIVIETATLFD